MDFPHIDEEQAEKLDPNYIYEVTEELPEFPGGIEAFVKWFSEQVKPHEEIGRCVVQFIVEKDGSISNPKIIKSVTPKLDAEAIRLVKAMPKWMPGKEKGKPVRVKYSIPMTFK
jgi:protein TonB